MSHSIIACRDILHCFLKFFFFFSFSYVWLHWVFIAVHRLSLVVVCGLLLLWSTGYRVCVGFINCDMRAQ